MAKRKKDEKHVGEPNWELAAKIMTDEIRADREDISKIQGDLSAFKRVENECGVNKKAAKDVFKLVGMSQELRDDYLRTYYLLMQQFNIGISADLIDSAEGKAVPTMPTRKADTQSALLN